MWNKITVFWGTEWQEIWDQLENIKTVISSKILWEAIFWSLKYSTSLI